MARRAPHGIRYERRAANHHQAQLTGIICERHRILRGFWGGRIGSAGFRLRLTLSGSKATLLLPQENEESLGRMCTSKPCDPALNPTWPRKASDGMAPEEYSTCFEKIFATQERQRGISRASSRGQSHALRGNECSAQSLLRSHRIALTTNFDSIVEKAVAR